MSSNVRCPECKWLGAYIGLNNVECPNIQCRHFSKRCYDELDKLYKEHLENEDKKYDKIYWDTNFNDFGDV